MAKKDIKIDFDREEDMLHIGKKDIKVKFSLDIELPKGDLIIDFDFQGNIAGIEFLNASNFFPFLKNIRNKKINGKMAIQYGHNWAEIYYEILIQGEKPISNRIISPYNKELVLAH